MTKKRTWSNIFTQKTKTYLEESHKTYLVKAVLELCHVALEDGGAHEVGEEDGLEVGHLVPVDHLDFVMLGLSIVFLSKIFYFSRCHHLDESFMLLTMASMMSMFAPLDTDILFVVGSTCIHGQFFYYIISKV